MKIVNGIYQVDGVNCYVYIVEEEEKLVLIDTGLFRNDKKIVNYIESLGRKPTDVSTIVITHYHIDHTGSLKKIKEATDAKVAAGEFDAEIVAGRKSAPKPKNLMFRAFSSVVKPAPVEPDQLLKDGDKLGRFTVILTAGHTEGSISLLDTERKVIFVGDALRFVDGKLTESPKQFNLDTPRAREAIGKIAAFDFDIMLGGHGDTLVGNASQKVKEFYATLK